MYKRLLIFPLFFFSVSLAADELGRLFTTANERAKLQVTRFAKPEKEVQVVLETNEPVDVMIEAIEEFDEVEEEEPPLEYGSLSLRGLVHRSNGKNTAWINDSNSYEGNLSSQYIKVDASDIKKDHVKMQLPDNEAEIRLKVGQTYEPVQETNEDISNN